MKLQTAKSLGLAALLATTANFVQADITLFQDNFESGNLDLWVGKSGGPHQGQIVADPLNPANHVLNFAGVNSAGDIFSTNRLDLSRPRQYVLRFDFLGLPNGGVPPTEYGGFVGISDAPSDSAPQTWLAGTYLPALNAPPSVATTLVADGRWHHYEVDITEVIVANQLTGTHLMLEDWGGLGSVPGDAYFDNLSVVGVYDTSPILAMVPCEGPAPGKKWKNHGAYVSTVSKVADSFLIANIIAPEEAAEIVIAAGESDCGKKK